MELDQKHVAELERMLTWDAGVTGSGFNPVPQCCPPQQLPILKYWLNFFFLVLGILFFFSNKIDLSLFKCYLKDQSWRGRKGGKTGIFRLLIHSHQGLQGWARAGPG